jgi:hypothetical protein
MSPQSQALRLVEILNPYLPFLLRGQEESPKRIAAVWHLLEPKLREQPAALEAFEDAAVDPGDADAKAALRLQVRKLLVADVDFAQRVEEALDKERTVAPGDPAAARNLLDLAGSGLWEGDLSEMREDRPSRRAS